MDVDGTVYSKPHMTRRMLLAQWHHLPFMLHERVMRSYRRRQIGRCDEPEKLGRGPRITLYDRWYKRSYLPAMVKVIGKYYHTQEWLQPMLDECRKRNIPVVLLSDYEAVMDKLNVLGLAPEKFAGIYTASDALTLKPDPRLGAYVMNKLYPDASERPAWKDVLFIGDRPDTDGELAKALGASFIRV